MSVLGKFESGMVVVNPGPLIVADADSIPLGSVIVAEIVTGLQQITELG